MKKAVVLHSGGLDSTTLLYKATAENYEVYSLSFNYGQKHSKEINLAKLSAKKAGVADHKIVNLNLDLLGGSALTDSFINIPDFDEKSKDIPITYVPARNMIFLSIAASYAETLGAQDIFIGVSQVDYSGYVDCRQEFIESMEQTINKGTVCAVEKNMPIKIHAPFMFLSKEQEIKLGKKLNVDYSLTWSCYKGKEKPCCVCDSCILRQEAFKNAGMTDPLINY
ncbi:MAG: 7-cyano-7-deazaguanine synthase QueC [Bacteroidetes bacterium]|jgi:7-cyano-7-deazaguanine synthase|nr:7-cyano-7-deazaguanine synthase QueC [Bacteroidota bacterium]MBT6685081.1 7-cyano-7-deazaguanine synthase QueC [Bacteroidota bacterium]MBT7142615.1 7-cyano-7-deazaguanine synthase QueC [Bacteroidota bacterium]MBT7493540.1 7-cyano-7-deazaguanine synthase QueC [Bacteroidota bacterium]